MTTTQQAAITPPRAGFFTEAMSRLASGLAVVTTRHGELPCGLLVSSLCSYSINPPSVLVAIDQDTRSHDPLLHCVRFGVHLLAGSQADLVRVFASRSSDKFTGLAWTWDSAVPRLHGVGVYLLCHNRRVFHDADHSILIGEVLRGEIRPGEPLVYYRRRLGWRLTETDVMR